MQEANAHSASGVQIAILVFAFVFLAYPVRKYLGSMLGLDIPDAIAGHLLLVPAIFVLAAVPSLRRFCMDELSHSIRSDRRLELGAVAFAKILVPFGIVGAIILWYWLQGGEMALARRIGNQARPSVEMAQALSWEGLVAAFVFASLLAPIVEELVFRGFLYRAWEAQWGWFASMLATSALFAAYHPHPFSAFVSAIVFVVVLRRTGSIRAPILVHAIGNLALWTPLMGQFYFRTEGKETGEIELWPFHLSMLALFAIALPAYVWMARDRETPDSSPGEEIVAANS